MDPADKFRLALAQYGRPLARERIHPDTAPGFAEFRRFFDEYMSHHGKVVVARVHCDWIENLSFNALATSHLGVECIGMFAGVPLRIYNHFYCFLSDPLVLSAIGAPSEEVRDAQGLVGLRRRELSPLPSAPRGQARRDAAMHLAWNATMFVFFHELAHIEACHLRLLKESHGLTEYLEVPALPVPSDEAHLRLLLELDADQLAANNLSTVWRSYWNDNAFNALSPLGLRLSWSISLSMLFMLMDSLVSFHPPLGHTTHPSPLARLIYIITLAGNRSISGFDIDEETALHGLDEVKRWWKRENLPVSATGHGVTSKVHDELAVLRLELAEKYWDRLTRYSLERRVELGLDA